MKKIILLLSIIFSGIYLINFISAISVNLNSGDILDNTTWGKISSVTDKISVENGDMKINGKIYISGDLCDNNGKCLGKCDAGKEWDNATLSCKSTAQGTADNPGESCKTILASGVTTSGTYRVYPDGGNVSQKFQVYCDMSTSGGGWTMVKSDTEFTHNSDLATYTRVSGENRDARTNSDPDTWLNRAFSGANGITADGKALAVGCYVDIGDSRDTYSMNFDLKIKFKEVRVELSNRGTSFYNMDHYYMKFGDYSVMQGNGARTVYPKMGLLLDTSSIWTSSIETNNIYFSNQRPSHSGGSGIDLYQLRVR